MLYEFKVYQMKVENHIFWVAESLSLKGCVGQGETSEDAIKELGENEKEWLDTAKEFGIPIPPITYKKGKNYSGKLALQISPYVHEKAAETAQDLGISLNQFVNDALIAYTSDVSDSFRKEKIPYPDTEMSTHIINFPVQNNSQFSNVQEELEEM